MITRLLKLLRQRPADAGAISPHPAHESDAALARAIEIIDPRLSLVRHYARHLRPATDAAWAYARAFVHSLPAPVDASPAGWHADSSLRMLFASAHDIPTLLGHHAQLNSFFQDHPEAVSACVLIGAGVQVKQVFGVEMQGDVLRQEVAQRALNFHGHRVIVPAASEAEARAELERRVYDTLLNQALQQISLIHSRQRNLEQRRAMLQARLRVLRRRPGGLDSLADAETEAQAREVEQLIEASTLELRAVKSTTTSLHHILHLARRVLRRPERYLRITPIRFRTDDMNRLLSEQAPPPWREAEFREVWLNNQPPESGVILLAWFQRQDRVPPKLSLDRAERYL